MSVSGVVQLPPNLTRSVHGAQSHQLGDKEVWLDSNYVYIKYKQSFIIELSRNMRHKIFKDMIVCPDKIVAVGDDVWGLRFPKLPILSEMGISENQKRDVARVWRNFEEGLYRLYQETHMWHNDIGPNNIAFVEDHNTVKLKLIDLDSFYGHTFDDILASNFYAITLQTMRDKMNAFVDGSVTTSDNLTHMKPLRF